MRNALTLLLLLTLGLAANADGPPVGIGAFFNLVGRQSNLDVPAYRGAQMAIDQANASGGVLGRHITLPLLDTASDLATVAEKTNEFLAEHPRLCALVGFSDTDFVLAAAPVTAKSGYPFVTSGATSPRLPKEVPDHLFLACFGDNVQAAVAADFASSDLKARTAFVVYDDSTEYTRLLQQYFVTHFQELGGKIVGTQSFSPGEADRLSLKAAKADVIFLSAGPQEALLGARRLRQLGLDEPILGGDGFDSNVWSQAKDLKDIYFTTHVFFGESNTRPAVVKFSQDFAAKYPDARPDAFAALGYDAVNLLLKAIANAGDADPANIQAALAKLDGFEGVTGTISFAGGSHIPKKTVSVVKIVKGQPTLVKEMMPQSVPAP